MKVREDVLPQAKAVLGEVLSLQEGMIANRDALRTFGPEEKKQYGSIPRFLVARRQELDVASKQVRKFSFQYPHIVAMINNGESSDNGFVRLNDGLYTLGQYNQKLAALKCMPKTDEDVNSLRRLMDKALADMCVFIITQYNLVNYDTEVMLSVSGFCNQQGISPSVFYGNQLHILESTGESVYGYESISPYRPDLLDIDPVFVAECEDAGFPLDEQMCKDIIDGNLIIAEARGQLASWLQQLEQKEVTGVTTLNMIQQMHLD